MNLIQTSFIPGVILAFLMMLAIVAIYEKRFFEMVRTYWFYKRSLFSYVSTFLFMVAMGLLLVSIADLRGPEEKIKTEVPSERTIILLDTSASMLAEDVKPSRLQKASLIAKHFARKAAGHQLSVVAFAEIQKKIVPFTNDLDLIDARLESLKNLRNQYASSALTIALQESIQYFREIDGEARGNIVVLTDGEETAEGIDLKVPKGIHVALVGIGTTQGGRIPLDDAQGFRYGYKKDKGQDVITKLNEDFFKKVTKDLPSAKYWIANSYTLPSDEILEFFGSEKIKGMNQQDMVIRPVMMEWLVIPAIILWMMAMLMKSLRVFTLGIFLFINQVQANEVKLSEEVLRQMNQLQEGKLSASERVKLADDMYKGGLKGEAIQLYRENLDFRDIKPDIPPEAYLNFGTALLEAGDTGGGLEGYERLLNELKDDTDKNRNLRQIMEKNILMHFKKKQSQQKKEQEKKEKNESDKKDNQGQGSGQGKQDQKNGKQDDQRDKNDKGDSKDKNDKQDDKQDGKDDQEDQNEQKQNDNDKQQKPMPKQKIPAKLKQLMSDDRQLQMRMIENGTRDLNKRKSPRSKDW